MEARGQERSGHSPLSGENLHSGMTWTLECPGAVQEKPNQTRALCHFVLLPGRAICSAEEISAKRFHMEQTGLERRQKSRVQTAQCLPGRCLLLSCPCPGQEAGMNHI